MDPWLFKRISVRHLVAGQAFDVIGRVIHRTNDVVHLMRRDGQIEDVLVVNIIAAREVPDDDRRLRPIHEFPGNKLSAIVERTLQVSPEDFVMLVADLRFLAPTVSSSDEHVLVLGEPDATWQSLNSDQTKWPGVVEVPESLRIYLSLAERGAGQAVLCGDWLFFDVTTSPRSGSALDSVAQLFEAATDWARPRGAVYAFTLIEADDLESVAILKELGFAEFKSQKP